MSVKLGANKDVTKDVKKDAIEVEKFGANKGVTLDAKNWVQKWTQKWMLKRTEKKMQQMAFYENVQQHLVQCRIVHHNYEKITLKSGAKFDAKSIFCCSAYTFKGKASTWYFSLTAGSITSWNEFDLAFTNKFGDDKTPAILV